MAAVKNLPRISKGIYTTPDVAIVLRLPTSKVRYWLNDFWDARFSGTYVKKYSWGDGKEKAVNFHTLIEFFVFYQLRQLGISSQKISKAHHKISEILKTPYPFATTKILTDKKSIFFNDEIDHLLSADDKQQYQLKDVIEPFCQKIDFDDSTLAQRLYPLGKQYSVVIDPYYQFGQPIIKGTNIQAQTLFMMNKGGDSPELLASLYDIETRQVNDAITFFSKAA